MGTAREQIAAIPGAARAVRGLRAVGRRGTAPLRRRYYAARARSEQWHLPDAVLRTLGLDDVEALGSRRLEIGSGPYPTPGYIHVDVDARNSRHVEVYAQAWALPLPSGWASEVRAVHSLEHVHPTKLMDTLAEWHRLLRPGGTVRVHVPNTPALMQAFTASPPAGKWRVMGAILGMYSGPEVASPQQLSTSADHQILFDEDLLRAVLQEAGFVEIQDRTAVAKDRHTEAWSSVVGRFSLIFDARKP